MIEPELFTRQSNTGKTAHAIQRSAQGPTPRHFLRQMQKTEVALLYAPHLKPRSACRALNRAIVRQPELVEALTQSGYRACQRVLTPRQIQLLHDYLGLCRYSSF